MAGKSLQENSKEMEKDKKEVTEKQSKIPNVTDTNKGFLRWCKEMLIQWKNQMGAVFNFHFFIGCHTRGCFEISFEFTQCESNAAQCKNIKIVTQGTLLLWSIPAKCLL